MRRIESLSIEGFKSFRKLENLRLNPGVNVIIGANGSGKSNLVEFFRMLGAMGRHQLQRYILERGVERVFRLGTKETEELRGSVQYSEGEESDSYSFALRPTDEGSAYLVREGHSGAELSGGTFGVRGGGTGDPEPVFERLWQVPGAPELGTSELDLRWISCLVEAYTMSDLGPQSPVRKPQFASDRQWLRNDFSNLGSTLAWAKHAYSDSYARLISLLRQVFPDFDGFHFEPIEEDGFRVRFEWKQRGTDYIFGSHQLSDGTMRFAAIAWALIHPGERDFGAFEFSHDGTRVVAHPAARPDVVVLDEPELGLHPHALELLAGLIRSVSAERQVIIATQSPALLSEFAPEDVLVVDSENGESKVRRLDAEPLKEWLEEYTLGELWWKNVFGGGTFAWRGSSQ